MLSSGNERTTSISSSLSGDLRAICRAFACKPPCLRVSPAEILGVTGAAPDGDEGADPTSSKSDTASASAGEREDDCTPPLGEADALGTLSSHDMGEDDED